MSESVIQTVIDHFVDRSADGAVKLVEALANKVGSAVVRQHLDAFDAARGEADAAETKKFGLFSKWLKK